MHILAGIIIHFFPFLSIDFLVSGLTKNACQSGSTKKRRSPTHVLHMGSERWLYHLDRFGVLAQINHIHCFVSVHFDELPEAVHHAFETLFPQTCNNTFHQAVTVFLLIRQELQRVDQVVAQSLLCSMRSNYLSFTPVSSGAYSEPSNHAGRHCFFHEPIPCIATSANVNTDDKLFSSPQW